MLIMTICTQLFVGCGKEDPVTDTADDQEADQREELTEETFGRAISGNGIVTSFISEQFYDGIINSNEDGIDFYTFRHRRSARYPFTVLPQN